jgi:methionyl-tRNA synthetase
VSILVSFCIFWPFLSPLLNVQDSICNLVSSLLNLCNKYAGGAIPDGQPYSDLFDIADLKAKVDAHFAAFQIHSAIEVVFEQFRHINNWLADKAPWKMKGDDRLPEQRTILR